MHIAAFYDMSLLIKTCQVCLDYKKEGARQERARQLEILRRTVLPVVLNASGVRIEY